MDKKHAVLTTRKGAKERMYPFFSTTNQHEREENIPRITRIQTNDTNGMKGRLKKPADFPENFQKKRIIPAYYVIFTYFFEIIALQKLSFMVFCLRCMDFLYIQKTAKNKRSFF